MTLAQLTTAVESLFYKRAIYCLSKNDELRALEIGVLAQSPAVAVMSELLNVSPLQSAQEVRIEIGGKK